MSLAGAAILIDVRTLTQFTGLYDSTTWEELTEEERREWTIRHNLPSEWKGKKIFEGDIVKITLKDNWERKGVIKFSQYYFSWVVSIPNSGGCYQLFDVKNKIKHIGNIFDNPKFLEGK
jgi:hypothetical protein